MAKRTSSKNLTHISMVSGRLDSLSSKPLSKKHRREVEEIKKSFSAFGVLNRRQNYKLTRIEKQYAT